MVNKKINHSSHCYYYKFKNCIHLSVKVIARVAMSFMSWKGKNISFVVVLAVGCPDLRAPRDGWVTRAGDDAVIGCNRTRDSWRMKCVNDKWIGHSGNCSTTGTVTYKCNAIYIY